MKRLLGLLLLGCGWQVLGQGSIVFRNDASSVVYTNALAIGGERGLTGPVPGAFYYALFMAPQGTTDPLLFTFSGHYATNTSLAGMYQGRSITSSFPGITAILVRGWSSNLGPIWEPGWANGVFAESAGFYGQSAIALVDFNAVPPPGPVGQYVGTFDLYAIPEPSVAALIMSALPLLARKRRKPEPPCS